jgi:hypothetical protein
MILGVLVVTTFLLGEVYLYGIVFKFFAAKGSD